MKDENLEKYILALMDARTELITEGFK